MVHCSPAGFLQNNQSHRLDGIGSWAGRNCLSRCSPTASKHWWLLGEEVSFQSGWQAGTGWMLAAAIAMAVGTVLSRFACRNSDPVAVTGWHMLLGGFPLLVWHGLDGAFPLIPPWSTFAWTQMAYASLMGGAVAYALFFWFASREDLTGFTTLGFLTPVFALASGGLLLQERLNNLQWLAVLLVLISVVLVSQRKRFWEPVALMNETQQGDLGA